MKKTGKIIWNIISAIISIVLCAAIGLSLLMATIMREQREYLASDGLRDQIQETKLEDIKFIKNGEKITMMDYLIDKVETYVESKLPSMSKFSGYAVDKVLSSEKVTQSIRDHVIELVDYVLYTDTQIAQERVDKNVSIRENEDFMPEEAKSIDDFIDRVIKTVTLEVVEDVSGMDIDQLIITLSEDNVKKYETYAIILFVIVILINIFRFENNFLYAGISLVVCGVGIKVLQNKYASLVEGGEDLASYVFLKPFMDSLSENAMTLLVAAMVLVGLFLVLLLVRPKIVEIIKNSRKSKTA